MALTRGGVLNPCLSDQEDISEVYGRSASKVADVQRVQGTGAVRVPPQAPDVCLVD